MAARNQHAIRGDDPDGIAPANDGPGNAAYQRSVALLAAVTAKERGR